MGSFAIAVFAIYVVLYIVNRTLVKSITVYPFITLVAIYAVFNLGSLRHEFQIPSSAPSEVDLNPNSTTMKKFVPSSDKSIQQLKAEAEEKIKADSAKAKEKFLSL